MEQPPHDEPGDDHDLPDNVIKMPLNERMRSRQRHPAGKIGRKPIEQVLRELDVPKNPDDNEPA